LRLRLNKLGVAQNREDSFVGRPKAFRTSAGVAGDFFGQSFAPEESIAMVRVLLCDAGVLICRRTHLFTAVILGDFISPLIGTFVDI
jgi:hypothetical protein